MDIREEIAVRALDGRLSVSEIARMYDVSRITVRLWRDRYREQGRSGLSERSHAAAHCPHKTSEAIEALIVADRLKFGFGSKKILRRLADEHPRLVLPPRSTADAILRRHGLVEPKPRRTRRHETPFRSRYSATAPGELFTIDHKGEFRLGTGRYCYPLTIVDSVSRYILACQALSSTRFDEAWPVIRRVFREHGLPVAMQSDNGPPFGSSQRRVSSCSVHLMMYGVLPVFGRPGHPQDNGRHERMHREVKRDATRPPGRSSIEQQRKFDDFIHIYNVERPHEGIGMERPATVFHSSPRPFPSRRPRPDYPLHFEKRKISEGGYLKWRNERIFIGDPLAGHVVGIEPAADGLSAVHFHQFVIGHIDERTNHFI
ncbi:MAG: integrase core domain-containing protein [Chloroflexi bacterium]|nr:integrase core domain-containing protein [Chloroflexota bacterium]